MWNPTNCDPCGDCFLECLYVDWDREKTVQEISSPIETGESEILTACVTCCGCNEYCEKGANPWDLILQRQGRKRSSVSMKTAMPCCWPRRRNTEFGSPFGPFTCYEYLLVYLKAHEEEIKKLNLLVAHQQPCASRYSRDKDPLLGEIA